MLFLTNLRQISCLDIQRNNSVVPGNTDRSYDFFTGNRHAGFPAFDIFIRDCHQDSRDNSTYSPVTVLSFTGDVVVALEREWDQESGLRGGKYLWIYDPAHDLRVYYAHNSELLVGLGEIVKPGDAITWKIVSLQSHRAFMTGKEKKKTVLRFIVRACSMHDPLASRQ